jgi:uncharacterized delta-60 repeat protein
VGLVADRRRQYVGVLLVGIALLATGIVSEAQAATKNASKPRVGSQAGRLDRSFNGDGKVVTAFPQLGNNRLEVNYRLPFEFASGRIVMAAGKGGKIVAANGKAIVAYLANGRPNPRFGGNGAVPIGPIEGSIFQLADIAVDSRGRILVAGTTRPVSQIGMTGPEVVGPLPSTATIRRYLPNGQLDPSFAAAGVLNTDLGASRPTFEGTPYPESSVALVGLTVDQANRPILTGSAVAEVGRCTPSQNRFQSSQAVVARLNENGTPDTSFAGNGLKSIGGLSWLGSPALASAGVLAAGTNVDPCPRGEGPDNPSVLVSVGSDGNLSQGFAANGFWSRPFTRISDVEVSPSGKLVLLIRTIELSGGEWVESAGRAVRLRRDGSFDPGFGHAGRADLPLPKRGAVAAIATDPQDRVLLAGSVFRHPKGKGPQSKFLLMRLAEDGEADLRFGRRGRVTTGFGLKSNVRATDVFVGPRNRIAVGGKFSSSSTNNGFALARYLGR